MLIQVAAALVIPLVGWFVYQAVYFFVPPLGFEQKRFQLGVPLFVAGIVSTELYGVMLLTATSEDRLTRNWSTEILFLAAAAATVGYAVGAVLSEFIRRRHVEPTSSPFVLIAFAKLFSFGFACAIWMRILFGL